MKREENQLDYICMLIEVQKMHANACLAEFYNSAN